MSLAPSYQSKSDQYLHRECLTRLMPVNSWGEVAIIKIRGVSQVRGRIKLKSSFCASYWLELDSIVYNNL